jgi:hypothetical protein
MPKARATAEPSTPRTPTADDAVAERPAPPSTAADGTRGGAVSGPLTPAAALARHIEWLEYALGAARAEEAARSGRVEVATKKNREKRTARLAEVQDEVAELTALLQGIRDLQSRGRVARTRTASATEAKAATPAGTRRRPAPAGA